MLRLAFDPNYELTGELGKEIGFAKKTGNSENLVILSIKEEYLT